MADDSDEELCEKQFKICLIGDSQVGKTSIASRYATDKLGKFPATVGVEFYLKRTTLPGPRHITLKVHTIIPTWYIWLQDLIFFFTDLGHRW